MSKNDKKPEQPLSVTASTEVRVEGGGVVNTFPAIVEASASEGRLTLSMFLTERGVPEQRRAGMRAFTKLKEATLSEWVAIFKKY